jgi:hypothetical protein
MLGFSVPKNAQILGISSASAMSDHNKTMQCFRELSGGGRVNDQDMSTNSCASHWGIRHEPNCDALLLNNADKISHLQGYSKVVLLECGLNVLDTNTLPLDVTKGWDISKLPRMAASPDGELRCYKPTDTMNTDPDRICVEYKCFCPFASNGDGFIWRGDGSRPSSLMPHHFAQCQLQMLTMGVNKTLLLSYGPVSTKVMRIDLDMQWCNVMLQLVSLMHEEHVLKPMDVPVDYCVKYGKGYIDFLHYTKKACAHAFASACTVNSIKGSDKERFLD